LSTDLTLKIYQVYFWKMLDFIDLKNPTQVYTIGRDHQLALSASK
jgi:hypothetical protein